MEKIGKIWILKLTFLSSTTTWILFETKFHMHTHSSLFRVQCESSWASTNLGRDKNLHLVEKGQAEKLTLTFDVISINLRYIKSSENWKPTTLLGASRPPSRGNIAIDAVTRVSLPSFASLWCGTVYTKLSLSIWCWRIALLYHGSSMALEWKSPNSWSESTSTSPKMNCQRVKPLIVAMNRTFAPYISTISCSRSFLNVHVW